MENYQFVVHKFDTNRAKDFFNLIESNRSRLEDFFATTVANTRTLKDTINYCKEFEIKRQSNDYFPFVIIDSDSSDYIGWIDIKNVDLKVPKCEIGYFIDSKYEGQGIISKAVGIVIKQIQAEFKFRKILCRAHARNKGSIKVALKNGFELEGVIRRDYRTTSDELLDLNYYGLYFD